MGFYSILEVFTQNFWVVYSVLSYYSVFDSVFVCLMSFWFFYSVFEFLLSFWVFTQFLSKTRFLKPFLKGKILRSSERGVNSILTTILRFWPTSWRDRIFCLVASDSARRKDHFQKKICPKRTFPSNFVKLVSKILYLFLAENTVVCLFVCLLLLQFLSDFGLLFF